MQFFPELDRCASHHDHRIWLPPTQSHLTGISRGTNDMTTELQRNSLQWNRFRTLSLQWIKKCVLTQLTATVDRTVHVFANDTLPATSYIPPPLVQKGEQMYDSFASTYLKGLRILHSNHTHAHMQTCTHARIHTLISLLAWPPQCSRGTHLWGCKNHEMREVGYGLE